MKKQAMALMAGLTLSMMALTGCNFGNNDDTAPVETKTTATAQATATSKATATEKPEAKTELTEAEGQAILNDMPKANGIDLDESMKSHLDPAVTANFPDHDVRDGAKQLLSTYLNVSSNRNMKSARAENDPTDGKLLFGFEDRMHGNFTPLLSASMDKDVAPFPATTRDGVITMGGEAVAIDGKTYHADGKVWLTEFGTPAINYVSDASYGSALSVKGHRSDMISTQEGEIIKCYSIFHVAGVPATNETSNIWLVAGMGQPSMSDAKDATTCEVVNASK